MMQMNNSNTPFYNRAHWGNPQPRYKAPSKVVSIPVHFVGSESSRTHSAIRIQKVLRGFLVRNIVRKITAIKVELDEIEKKVHDAETVKLMRKEQRERVRIGEGIMNLLLKLDSVRVFHYSALRDCRKSLIKKAIALQEFVDQIQDEGVKMESLENDGVKIEALENDGGKIEALENDGGKIEALEDDGAKIEALENDGVGTSLVKEEEHVEGLRNEEEEDGEGKYVGEESVGTSLVEEVGENYLVKEKEGQVEEIEALRNEEVVEEEDKEKEEGEGEEGVGGTGLVEENCLVKEEEGGVEFEEEEKENFEGGRREDCDGNRVLLEKMMEDNERMMEMMQQLFQRNEMQTKLLTSLSKRVDQLERAFACDKLRRKKRINNADPKHKETHPKNGSI